MAASNGASPAMFSPAASGTRVADRSACHGPRTVRAQRLLEPVHVERFEPARHVDRGVERPGLIRVGHQRALRAERAAQRAEVREIALAPEADLQLERAKAFVALRVREA